jgi:DNA-binding GntR family transcriptional regulator
VHRAPAREHPSDPVAIGDQPLRAALDEHVVIFDAIRAGDADAAEQIVRQHVMAGLEVIETFL